MSSASPEFSLFKTKQNERRERKYAGSCKREIEREKDRGENTSISVLEQLPIVLLCFVGILYL